MPRRSQPHPPLVALADWRRTRNADVPVFFGVVLAGVAAMNNLLKWTVDRDRPDVVHLVETSRLSFPSGHSATAAAASCAIALVITRHRRRRAARSVPPRPLS